MARTSSIFAAARGSALALAMSAAVLAPVAYAADSSQSDQPSQVTVTRSVGSVEGYGGMAGRVGPQTQGALDEAPKARGAGERTQSVLPLSDPKSPDHALYEQALAGVQKIDADMGRRSDQLSRNLAANLAAEAKALGLTRIDSVAISEDGARTFAVQNESGVRRYADVTTAQAVRTPIEQSSLRAASVQTQASEPDRASSQPVVAATAAPSRDSVIDLG